MSQLGIGSSWLPLLSELSESPRQRRKHAVTTCNFLQQWQQRQQHQKQWFGHNYCYLSWLILWKENETTGYKQHETKNKWQKRIERKKKIFQIWFMKARMILIILLHVDNYLCFDFCKTLHKSRHHKTVYPLTRKNICKRQIPMF